jgi:hypothetical protein
LGSNMWSQVKDVGLFWLCASPMINLLWNLCTEDGREVERWLEEELDDHKLDRWAMVTIRGVWRWLLCKEFQRTNWINILASIFPQSDVLGRAAAPPRVIMHVCCNDGRRTLFLPRYLASKRSGDFRAVQGKWRVTPDENALSVHTKSTQIPLVIKRMRESCPCDPEC